MTSVPQADGFGGSQKHGKDHVKTAPELPLCSQSPEDTQGCESRQGVEEVWKDIPDVELMAGSHEFQMPGLQNNEKIHVCCLTLPVSK